MSALLFHLALGSLGLLGAVLVTAAALRLLRGRPAGAYLMAASVLGAAVFLPLGQWALEGRSPDARELETLWPPPAAAEVSPLARTETSPPLAGGTEGFGEPQPVTEELLEALLASTADSEASALTAPTPAASLPEEEPEALFAPPAVTLTLAALAPWLVGAWLLGVVVFLSGTLRRLLGTRALLAEAVPLEHEEVLASWRRVSADSPLADRVRLLTSDQVRTPVCFGWQRPVVVVPATAPPELDAEALACVLLHELVHLERRDTWVMLIQELFRALFWFHPAAWWLSRRLDGLRELSCDWWVVRRLGGRRKYARALVEFAARMGEAETRSPINALLPWFGRESQLSRRIEMLVHRPTEVTGLRRFVPYATAGLLFVGLWGGQLATAASLRFDPSPQETAPEPPAIPTVQPLLPMVQETEPEGVRWEYATESEPVPEPVVRAARAPRPEPPGLLGQITAPPAPTAPSAPLSLSRRGGQQSRALTNWVSADSNGGTFGIRVTEVNGAVGEVLADYLGLEGGGALVITGVEPGSFAEQVGLRTDDILLGINGQTATLGNLRAARAPGLDGKDPWVSFDVLRKGDRKELGGTYALPRARGTGPDARERHNQYVKRALALLQEGRSEEAQELLNRAMELDPSRLPSRTRAPRTLVEERVGGARSESGRGSADRRDPRMQRRIDQTVQTELEQLRGLRYRESLDRARNRQQDRRDGGDARDGFNVQVDPSFEFDPGDLDMDPFSVEIEPFEFEVQEGDGGGSGRFPRRAPEPIVMKITRDGEIVNDGRRYTPEEVRKMVRGELRMGADRPVLLQVEEDAPQRVLVEAIEQSKAGGARSVNLSAPREIRLPTDGSDREMELESQLERTRRELEARSAELDALRRRLEALEARAVTPLSVPPSSTGSRRQ